MIIFIDHKIISQNRKQNTIHYEFIKISHLTLIPLRYVIVTITYHNNKIVVSVYIVTDQGNLLPEHMKFKMLA